MLFMLPELLRPRTFGTSGRPKQGCLAIAVCASPDTWPHHRRRLRNSDDGLAGRQTPELRTEPALAVSPPKNEPCRFSTPGCRGARWRGRVGHWGTGRGAHGIQQCLRSGSGPHGFGAMRDRGLRPRATRVRKHVQPATATCCVGAPPRVSLPRPGRPARSSMRFRVSLRGASSLASAAWPENGIAHGSDFSGHRNVRRLRPTRSRSSRSRDDRTHDLES